MAIQGKHSIKRPDYQTMWERLRGQMHILIAKNVSIFHPAVVLQYMGFIEQIEEAEKEKSNG